MLRSKNGSAIIIVLIVSIIAMGLTLFAIGVSKRIVQSSDMLMDKLNAEFGVESAVEKLKFYVSTGKFSPLYVENKIAGLPDRIYVDGRKLKIDSYTTITVQDSGGLINVWSFNTKLLNSLLRNDNISRAHIAIIDNSIEDWYDKDDLQRVNGAEDWYYKGAGCKYTPRNFSMVQSIYEWHDIRGLMDNKTFNFIKKYLILSPKWHININAMSKTMLSAAFNIPLPAAKAIVAYRNQKNGLTAYDLQRLLGVSIDSEQYRAFPTFVLDIEVQSKFNEAMENVSSQIQFIQNRKSPYRILKWQN